MSSNKKLEVDFSYHFYSSMLDQLKEKNYHFKTFDKFDVSDTNTCALLRHDIDKSVPKALDIAIIEAEKGIKSTFFVRLHSNYYNPFSYKCYRNLMQIADLGHEIGLHTELWDISLLRGENKIDMFLREKQILESIVQREIKSFSLHRTTGSSEMEDANELLQKIETMTGMNNAYSTKFQVNFKYLSDSSGIWREGDPRDYFTGEQHLHFLTHPIWWFRENIALEDPIV